MELTKQHWKTLRWLVRAGPQTHFEPRVLRCLKALEEYGLVTSKRLVAHPVGNLALGQYRSTASGRARLKQALRRGYL